MEINEFDNILKFLRRVMYSMDSLTFMEDIFGNHGKDALKSYNDGRRNLFTFYWRLDNVNKPNFEKIICKDEESTRLFKFGMKFLCALYYDSDLFSTIVCGDERSKPCYTVKGKCDHSAKRCSEISENFSAYNSTFIEFLLSMDVNLKRKAITIFEDYLNNNPIK